MTLIQVKRRISTQQARTGKLVAQTALWIFKVTKMKVRRPHYIGAKRQAHPNNWSSAQLPFGNFSECHSGKADRGNRRAGIKCC